MATYTKTQLDGQGVLGEALSGAKNFRFRNTTQSSSLYFTLESVKTGPPISSSYDDTSTKVNGVLSIASLSSTVDITTAIQSDYKWAVIIPKGNGGIQNLKFTPTTAIPANSYRLRIVGSCDSLQIS
tara:strand:+ start:1033 stop:1413 length:381 start_codon:yes stop_codon:yes gene_type:complete